MRPLPLILLLAAVAALSSEAPAQQTPPTQHSDGAPEVIAGPQTPGTQPAPSAEPTLMDNDAVLRMHKAGLTDPLILQTIATQPGRYDSAPDALIALKQAGLSDEILAAMASKQSNNRRQLTAAGPLDPKPIDLSPVNEIGVYYKDRNGTWQPMESEVVHMKSGGFLKSTLSDGIIKQDRNGTVEGGTAKLILPAPEEFLIYTPDGVSADEYDLVLFRLHGNRREFRAYTGGIIHGEQSAKRDEVPFTPKRIAARTYTFSIPHDIGGGEYGILPPGAGNITNSGKIYTFAITE